MGDSTEIAWTDSTFNPWIGCTNVSPGCDHCYAETLATRYGWAKWGKNPRKRTSIGNWRKPIIWNADGPRFERQTGHRHRVFCASLADVFDNQVPKDWRADLFRLIRECKHLDWQLLTKRPQNVAKMLPPDWGAGYPNVWLGTTTEDAEHYRQRWPVLARIPAAVRFISYEPAIGPLGDLRITDTPPDWVICGGESGPGARTMNAQWAREARDRCKALGIPFFFKQWGTYHGNPATQAEDPPSNGKGGALLDSRPHRQFPGRQDVPQRASA